MTKRGLERIVEGGVALFFGAIAVFQGWVGLWGQMSPRVAFWGTLVGIGLWATFAIAESLRKNKNSADWVLTATVILGTILSVAAIWVPSLVGVIRWTNFIFPGLLSLLFVVLAVFCKD